MTAWIFSKLNRFVFVSSFSLVGCGTDHQSAKKPELKEKIVSEIIKDPILNADFKGINNTKLDSDFEIAKDPTKHYTTRVSAALRLNNDQINVLRLLLLERLSNNYTKQALDDTSVLAKIGDENTAKGIELLYSEEKKAGSGLEGKLNSCRRHAIKEIRERQIKK